ncbi:MAG TPA: PAS domain-containing sensor histidine kinase, partial [Longimicrobiales bacterium]|nr:PAS domain-containing sensor histidine kinase [Longimicrobiales bacterium]
RLSLLKQRQMGRFEMYMVTGDRTFRDQYVAAIAEEDAIFDRLSTLASDLDFRVRERLARLRSETFNWILENTSAFNAPSVTAEALQRSRRGHEVLQRMSRELDQAIQTQVAAGRREMQRVRDLQIWLTFGLGLLALGATVVVGRVGWHLRDLTEEAERRRRDAVQARREIDSLLEATGDGVLGIDLDGKCISLNRAGVELLGYTEREIEGRDVHDTIFHSWADGSPRVRQESPILTALVEGRSVDSPDYAVLWRRRSEKFPARWSLRPLVDGTELRGAVLTFTDMTEAREQEAALRRAVQQREDVVSIVSHDLRNPLGVVLAASEILLELPLGEEERRHQAEIIRRSGKRMQNLIEDLLDVSRIEARAFVVRPSREELLPILEEARGLFHEQAGRRGVELRIEGAAGNTWARVDRDRILQALANLLDNALRVTKEGGRVVLGVADIDGVVDLSVSDTGPGIPPRLLENLFDRFSQSEDDRAGGAGLGLAIVRGVAEAHGGEVMVESDVGGTTFTIRLPRGSAPTDGARAASVPAQVPPQTRATASSEASSEPALDSRHPVLGGQ